MYLYIQESKKCINNLIEVIYGRNHKFVPKCNVRCSVIFSEKNSAIHMNASATLSNGRTVKENGDGMMCINFLGVSVYKHRV
jgi:hypothetical protein